MKNFQKYFGFHQVVGGVVFFFITFLISSGLTGEQLPKPTYENSCIISFFGGFLDVPPDVEYLKSQFGNGLYAPFCFSVSLGIETAWNIDISSPDSELQFFKKYVDSLVDKAKSNGVGLHLVLFVGMSRNPYYYRAAKEEDIRNAQWYNDNNLALPNDNPNIPTINTGVYTTLSRYARKLRAHIDIKTKLALEYLKKKQDENPNLLLIISGPGEIELNSLRINNNKVLQDFFCDYSPFSILEFRDWIKHEGLYGPGGKYEGQGYKNGGTRYQGGQGLDNFNQDFKTHFVSWDLKYYNWSLSDPIDTDYLDDVNPDPGTIPVSAYKFGGMLPDSGSHFIDGGFDPPRQMKKKGEDLFWDLWHLYRETSVFHFVKDFISLTREAGLPKDRIFTHQIPAEYLFGTRPDDPNINLNPRYYTSASPLWTADVFPDVGLGMTMYDINFRLWIARTSLYLLPAIAALGRTNWGAMEYNPEVTAGETVEYLSSPEDLHLQIMKLYDHNAHMVSFYRWTDILSRQVKGNNRETAIKLFFDSIKDRARMPVKTVYTPRTVKKFTGSYNSSNKGIVLNWSDKIWTDLKFRWSDWGDFKEFVIYRGYTPDFQCNSSFEIARTTGNVYVDQSHRKVKYVFYKIKAMNTLGQMGSSASTQVYLSQYAPPSMSVSRKQLNFGASTVGKTTPPQTFRVINSGGGIIDWTVKNSADWISCTPSNGINTGIITVSVNPSGKPSGIYMGNIEVKATVDSKEEKYTIQVKLKIYFEKDGTPFGSLDTPVNGAAVQGSIPVTGWVIDDIYVENVKIFRQTETDPVYIGDAVFVEGARPDVEAAFPMYPLNQKAGWGYLLLSNSLPNKGNGTFTIFAAASDNTGHIGILGSKTITCDNANAVKPFGGIDTPLQGGTASGQFYLNYGWVLTPQPNSIPIDGSTIDVYVDGVLLGNPVYNIFREDIARYFPGYANSNGAVGYFELDTSAYSNGTHSIIWVASDSAGNSDGIGSRFFQVQNPNKPTSSLENQTSFGHIPPVIQDSHEPVLMKKGYDSKEKPNPLTPDSLGRFNIKLHEMDRIELYLGNHARWVNGYPLPLGSTFDRAPGVFYWQLPAGFIKNYPLTFIGQEKNGNWIKKTIHISVIPKFSR